MRFLFSCLLLMSISGWSISSQAAIAQKAAAFVLCKNKKDVRTIRVLSALGGAESCTITYSKGSTEEVVGSNRSLDTCRSIMKNIQVNLENSKWSCRAVQSARVMSSSEVMMQ